ncbi:MAG TPA: HAMP domain-containing sensor histidine kinase [Acidimicrobiales bacterium]|nr:HAMP domain-containing sensor histidine kinase [Acidimicrobiales bacterium]
MRMRGGAPRSRLVHATRVAAMSTLLIATVYAAVSVTFDVVDSHRLVSEVDAHLKDRLHDVVVKGDLSRSRGESEDDRDVEVAPVLLWQVGADGRVSALSDSTPRLPRQAWSRDAKPTTSVLGSISFRVLATPVGNGWLVGAQSLTDTRHVEAVLIAGEAIAGPVVVVTMFLGALIIGLKASRPVELARRKQLEFTADASHELRTPLSVIEAEVTLALSTPRDAARYRDALERVNGESNRLRLIIDDLLWLARFDAEPTPPGDELVDLLAVAHSCEDRFGAIAHARGIALSVERHGGSDPLVTAPSDWIDRLAGVLMDNACRYAGSAGSVSVVVSTHGNRASLAVEDSGPGIAPDERAQLFDRFHRVTDDGSGTGLGLAIADSIVRSTGGRWNVTEATLGGARFEVSWHRSHVRDSGPMVLAGDPDTSGLLGARPPTPTETVLPNAHLTDQSLGGDSNP